MLAITVQQPWAWAIIYGGKDVENRTRIGTWRRAIGERIAIHAGLRLSDRGASDERVTDAAMHVTEAGDIDDAATIAFGVYDIGPITLGAIIGTVVVDDVHPEQGGCCAPWGQASYVERGGGKRVAVVHLRLVDPSPCTPIDCRGALGLWTFPGYVTSALDEVH